MQRFLGCLFVCFFQFQCLLAENLSLKVQAESAILMNAETGAILYEKNAKVLQYPASITKIATASYGLKMAGNQLETPITAEQDAVVSISEEARRKANYSQPAYWLVPGGSHIGIKKGEILTLKDLLYGLMVASGNDAANVIAQYIGGTIPDFMISLNRYLKEIGCEKTTFYNPHGLYHPKHQTTAYDMAIMMREALKNPKFCEIIGTVRYTRPKTNKQEPTVLVQTNRLMRKGQYYYPKAIGGKTGYLAIAGHTLVVAAKQEDRTLIAVLLKSKERGDMFLDAIKMFDTAFNQPKVQRTLLKAGPQQFSLDLKGAAKSISTALSEDLIIDYYPAEEPKLKCFLSWSIKEPPVMKGQQVGELQLQSPDGKVVRTIPLLAQEDVSTTWLYTLFGL